MIVRFRGVAEVTEGGVPVKLIAVVVACVAFGGAVLAALAALLWIFAAAAAVIITGGVPALVMLRRYNRRQAEKFLAGAAARRAAFAAETARPQVKAPQPVTVIQNFHGGNHVHIGAGTDPALIRQALPDRDAEIIRRSQRPE